MTGCTLEGCIILPPRHDAAPDTAYRALKATEGDDGSPRWVLVDYRRCVPPACPSGAVAPYPRLLRALTPAEAAWAHHRGGPVPDSLYAACAEVIAVWSAHADLDPGDWIEDEDDPTEEGDGSSGISATPSPSVSTSFAGRALTLLRGGR